MVLKCLDCNTRHTPQLYATKKLPRSEEVPWETVVLGLRTGQTATAALSLCPPSDTLTLIPQLAPALNTVIVAITSPAPSCGLRINKSPRAQQQLLRRSSILQSERTERIISGPGNNNNMLHNGYCCSHKLILTRP